MKEKIPRKNVKVSDKSGDRGRSKTARLKEVVNQLVGSFDGAVCANNRLGTLYHELAMEARDPKCRETFLELEQRVRRDQAELIQVIRAPLQLLDKDEQGE